MPDAAADLTPHWVHEPLEETLDGARMLSVSVADRMTRSGWEALARVAGIPARRWRAHHPLPSGAPLITLQGDGRAAFDAAAWARVVSLVPGAAAVPARTAELFGVARGSVCPPGRPPIRLLDLWRARRLRARLRRGLRTLDADHAHHEAAVTAAVEAALAPGEDGTPLAALPAYALAARLELLAGATAGWEHPALVDLAAALETTSWLRERTGSTAGATAVGAAWDELVELQSRGNVDRAALVPEHLAALAALADDAQRAAWADSSAGWHASRDLVLEALPLRDDLDRAMVAARKTVEGAQRRAGDEIGPAASDVVHPIRRLAIARERIGRDRARHVAGLRALVWSLAASLEATGALARADDAFDLTLDELVRLARGGDPEGRHRGAGRVRRTVGALDAEAPAPVTGSELRGVPASGGVVTARVVVLDDPALDADVDDAVLVCRTTDPAWTPLLLRCAALVTERGSELSHAAIVARELAIPCVVAAAGARLAARGSRSARVDGVSGVVVFDPPGP